MRNLFSMIFLIAAMAVLSGEISAQAAIPKSINGGVLNGKATSMPKPEYPQSAREAGIGGTVSVTVIIDESGAVISALADTTTQGQKKNADGTVEMETVDIDMSLRGAAEVAALLARFSPTLLSGKPVQVTGKIVYNFVPDSGMAMATVPRAAVPIIAGETKTVSGGVLNSRALSLPAVLYPPAARAVKAEGTVQVQVLIDESGNVVSAQAVSGHPLLRSAAVSGAQSAKFTPTKLSGEPVKVSGVITYTFELPKSDDK